MDTITFTHQGQTFNVPVVVAFGPNGKPVDLLGDVEPENCDHAGACWSSNLDMRCPRCGSRLFLPPRFLARRSEEAIETMHALWVRAGWPEFIGGQAARWNMRPEYWTVIPHPLFAHVGGLAVRNERLDSKRYPVVHYVLPYPHRPGPKRAVRSWPAPRPLTANTRRSTRCILFCCASRGKTRGGRGIGRERQC